MACTALCGSSGEDESSAWSIYIDELTARDVNYNCKAVEKSKKAITKRRKKKDLEDLDDIQAAEGTVCGPGIAERECDLLWRPTTRFSIKK